MHNKDIENNVAKCYSTWGTTYHDEYYGEHATYPPVHKELLLHILEEHHSRRILDAGCGPASFLRYLFHEEREIFGFDLTQEMVEEGKRVIAEMGYDSDRIWQGSVLESSSYTRPQTQLKPYDAVVCTGVLPHIPKDQEHILFKNLAKCLSPKGLLLLEGRNELFSLFTMNRYTDNFIRERLIQEKTLLTHAQDYTKDIQDGLKEFSSLLRLDLPPQRKSKGNDLGYDEILSRTHNPFELKEGLEKEGFTNVKPLFYHYHCIPPMLQHIAPKIFREQSLAMENPEDWRGYFMASAFIMTGTKE